MAFFDGYLRYNRMDGMARRMCLVVPHDTESQAVSFKRLRILNDTDQMAYIKIRLAKGDPIILPVPPLSLIYEDIIVYQVFETGTTEGLIIHGYYD